MDIGMMDVWRIIKRRFLMIVLIIMLTLVATGWLSVFILQPEYEATAKLLVQSQNTGNQTAYPDLDTNQKLMTTYSEIIKSNRIAEDVIKQLNLTILSKELLKKVKIHATEDSLITSVSVRDHDPKMAVSLANGFARSFYENLGDIMKVDNVSILDEAKLPANPTPIRPKPILNMAVALILSLFAGVCIALMTEFLDRAVKTEEHAEALLGLPVLGVVNHYKSKKRRKRKKGRKRKKNMKPEKAKKLGEAPIENESNPIVLP